MGASKLAFTCIIMKAVDNVQSWVNKGCDMQQSIEKTDYFKDYYFQILFASNLDT